MKAVEQGTHKPLTSAVVPSTTKHYAGHLLDSLSLAVVRAEQNALDNAQMLATHFAEQKTESLRHRSPRCENENPKDGACEGEAKDVCVHCELALCYTGGCFDDVCAVAPNGKHLPSKKAIEAAVENLADKMRMVG